MPQNPHDSLFRLTFKQPGNAAALIKSNVPAVIAERIEWSTLALTNGSYVDPDGQWRHSDLVFTANIDGRPGIVYVLIEHQSTEDPRMALRVASYVLRVWEDYLREHKESRTLPAVVPLVVYHGDTTWKAPTRLLDLIDLDEEAKSAFAPHMLDMRFLLDDLGARGAAGIRDRALSPAALLTTLSLLEFPDRDANETVPHLADVLQAVSVLSNETELLAMVVWYIRKVAEPEPDREQIRQLFSRYIGTSTAEVVMSTADRFEERAEARGRAQGRAEVLIKLLRLRFREVPEATEQRVRAASIDELDALAERVLTATSVEEVFARR